MKGKLKVLIALMISCVMAISMFGCSNTNINEGKITVRLNEVTRSVFYAPMYVALSKGFFNENGIEIDLQTGQGADKTMQAVLSKSADIGFCGPEQTIYTNNQGREDYPILFAQLTQKDGSFLVGRTKEENFKWDNIKGKQIIGGRPGGVPEMAFEYAMKKNNINPKTDVNMITNIDFSATAGAFRRYIKKRFLLIGNCQ